MESLRFGYLGLGLLIIETLKFGKFKIRCAKYRKLHILACKILKWKIWIFKISLGRYFKFIILRAKYWKLKIFVWWRGLYEKTRLASFLLSQRHRLAKLKKLVANFARPRMFFTTPPKFLPSALKITYRAVLYNI